MCTDTDDCKDYPWSWGTRAWTDNTSYGGDVGLARDGHVIKGPYNEDGELWDCDDHDICNATFAGMGEDTVVFHTKSVVGLYSVRQNCVFSQQRLTQARVESVVRGVVVNPSTSSIAVLLEVLSRQAQNEGMRNLIIVWPRGQLHEEEPLKICIEETDAERAGLEPTILCSTSSEPLTIAVRMCSSKVICWKMNRTRSQLAGETMLTERGGLIALSGNGNWLAVAEQDESRADLSVWHLGGADFTEQRKVASMSKRPSAIAIAGSSSSSSTFLATTSEVAEGGAHWPHIEVFDIREDGSMCCAYRVRTFTYCRMLQFCYGTAEYLFSAHDDGTVVVCNLPKGKTKISHDNPGTNSVNMCTGRKLIVTTIRHCLRIYKAPNVGDA